MRKQQNVSIKDFVKANHRPRTTMDIIRAGNPHAFALWGAKDISMAGTKLQFTVNGNEMLITFNLQSKSYFINYYKIINRRKKVINSAKDVKESELYKELTNILGEV